MSELNRRSILSGAALGAAAAAVSAPAAAQAPAPAARRFAGKVVAVTGATSGIGRAAAERFAAEGAKVVFNGRRANLGAEVERGIRERGGEATYVQTDVRDPAQVQRFFQRVGELHGGKLDALANNAGTQTAAALTSETDFDDYNTMMETNVRGVWLGVQGALPLLRANGGGAIVNTASIHAFVSRPSLSLYSATKGAVMAMTRSQALELGEENIRVNAVCPGPIDTEMLRRFADTEEKRQTVAEGIYGLKRLGRAEEAAAPIVWLASEDASFVSGAAFVVDGATMAAI